MDDAEDARRALVARRADVESAQSLQQGVVGGEADERHGTRVRRIGEQGAEGEDHADAALARDVHDLAGEGAPFQLGLRADEDDDVPLEGRVGVVEEGVAGPGEIALVVGADGDGRAGAGEVVELLGLDVGEALAPTTSR